MINKVKMLMLLILMITQCSAQDQIVELCDDQKAVFEYKAVGTPFSNWTWNVYQDGNMTESSNNETIIVRYSAPGTYRIEAQIENLQCKSKTQMFEVLVMDCRISTLYFPTTFTPNKDGINELFTPTGTLIIEYSLVIFNRWGQLIFKSDDLNFGWDGTYLGQECPTGSYPYICKYKDVHNKRYVKSNNVILCR
jgi:gliding motility-associated-like protein